MGARQPPTVDQPDEPARGPRPPAPTLRHEITRDTWPVLAVVSVGGAIGASARYGAALIWPTAPAGFPWTTLVVNVVGCAVIGVFMVVISDVWAAHRLVRPFFGTGVLGGFTTFSTYAVDIRRLLEGGHARTGVAYLGLTLLAALAAVWSAVWLTRRAIAWRQS
ncbi:fluoride efflux transporter CrcB [Streptomyces sp. NBC_01387]|uniref:fluoride efflux transporter CrcB n=1 Tax=Streptomyces sp. NBC_01387 TaxID=2903849 RepID=UPI0032539DA7